MSAAKQIEWLSLVEVTGPFLAVEVLDKAMPQGLEAVPPIQRKRIRSAYEEWSDAVDQDDPRVEEFHREWIRLVLEELLEYDSSVMKGGDDVPESIRYQHPQTSDSIRPDYAVLEDGNPKLLVASYPPGTDLESPLEGEPWAASPLERMTLMCRSIKAPISLVTNGERWTLVGAMPDGTASYGSWYARIWLQEPITLQAFQTLLGVRRCFGSEQETLAALFTESIGYQEGITDTLGEQVRRAIEVLIQALDRADLDRDRELLKDISPEDLYDAGLTVMMRLVFLLCAEERKLLLLGEPTYDQNYAISTLRSQLKEEAERHGVEVLERRHDAWTRLLATFRGVYGGIEHPDLRLPALGGSLFDPDQYPFLEGRNLGTRWVEEQAVPLPVDNRTVLMLLNALQVLEQSGGAQHLSYEALDVEQIGHVYEGLLEWTTKRTPEITLALKARASISCPTLKLDELESAFSRGENHLLDVLSKATGSAASTIRANYEREVSPELRSRLLAICAGDVDLHQRLERFANFLKIDAWGDPLVYGKDAFIVTLGSGRRETGTHYTPQALTAPMVERVLEPLVYHGADAGLPKEKWTLKTSREILSLKICDMAIGSGAFLVQACRWLGERLLETWEALESNGKTLTLDDCGIEKSGRADPLPPSSSDRLLFARRLVASRCLYGVDINPTAVELAKLSLWLITMMKGRPFSFVDHALRVGDSLVGIAEWKHLIRFSIREIDEQTKLLSSHMVEEMAIEAGKARTNLEALPSLTPESNIEKDRLLTQAKLRLDSLRQCATLLTASEIACKEPAAWDSIRAAGAIHASSLIADQQSSKGGAMRTPGGGPKFFHWPVEFPEIFSLNAGSDLRGFDAVIGNPPWGSRNDPEQKHWLNLAYKLVGDYEMAHAFVERGLSIIKNGGRLTLVLPNTFLLNDSAKLCRSGLARKCTVDSIINLSKREIFSGATVRSCVIFATKRPAKKECKTVYLNELNQEMQEEAGFDVPHSSLESEDHWGEARLRSEDLPKLKTCVSDSFHVKQGYIPYRKSTLIKRFGEVEGNRILKERAWHSNTKRGPEYLRELKGKDVNRWSVNWSGPWVRYGDWVSTYLDPDWFSGERVLVREIVGKPPRLIIASRCDEVFVHNPSIIVCKPKVDIPGLCEVLEIFLNSQLGSRCVASVSAKAEKGLFPKVIVKDIRALPFPKASELSESLLSMAKEVCSEFREKGESGPWPEVDEFAEKLFLG